MSWLCVVVVRAWAVDDLMIAFSLVMLLVVGACVGLFEGFNLVFTSTFFLRGTLPFVDFLRLGKRFKRG